MEKNQKKAVYWYTKAAKQGDAYAQTNLGVCYEEGMGVEIDQKKAVEWFTKAAEQGNADAEIYLDKYSHIYDIEVGGRKIYQMLSDGTQNISVSKLIMRRQILALKPTILH